MKNIIPIIPVAIDSWRMRDIVSGATIIRTTAPQRSDRGARLRNAHQTTTASPHKSPAITPKNLASGTAIGTPNINSHCSDTAATPGHSRSGLCGVCASVCAMVMLAIRAPQGFCSPIYRAFTLNLKRLGKRHVQGAKAADLRNALDPRYTARLHGLPAVLRPGSSAGFTY
jgi:hypothetical protein